MHSIGIFAGIGAIELGFARASIEAAFLCELDPVARSVLKRHFPRKRLFADVKDLRSIPKVEVLSAGFPCQDLSAVGPRRGLDGSSSGVIAELFRLLRPRATRPDWIVLENVPFMLELRRGQAMSVITNNLEGLGYTWAYRVIDSRAFGLPQRRRRVFMVASLKDDPRSVLFEESHIFEEAKSGRSHGFYWTEGNSGIGWAVDAIPALKAGSTLSIPSPPAVWLPDSREIITPDIRDAERLQGLPRNWTRTRADEDVRSSRLRWRLVGNAVTVPVAEWIGKQIRRANGYQWRWDEPLQARDPWPKAAWGCGGRRFAVRVSEFPVAYRGEKLHSFLHFDGKPLSARAASGLLGRLQNSTLIVRRMFLRDLQRHTRAASRGRS